MFKGTDEPTHINTTIHEPSFLVCKDMRWQNRPCAIPQGAGVRKIDLTAVEMTNHLTDQPEINPFATFAQESIQTGN